MKKTLITLLALTALVVVAQEHIGEAFTFIKDSNGTSSCTNYLGWARTTENSTATPSTSEALWKITKEVLDSDGVVIESKNAYGSGEGYNALWSNVWTNRASATYR